MLSRKRNIKLGTRVLKLGSRGTDVGQLQQKLRTLVTNRDQSITSLVILLKKHWNFSKGLPSAH